MSTLRQRGRSAGQVRGAEEQDDNGKSKLPELESSTDVSFGAALMALLLSRYFSASSNIVHDCDEVFNYWEPFHYILYKSGFQTWEYSSEFALRSYLYLLLHAIIGFPAALLHGNGYGKVKVFYLVRLVLGIASAVTEAALVYSVSRKFGKRMATYALVLLCFTSGCYTASTTFLPSTFSMYAVSLAAAALLADRHELSVVAAAIGVLVGWPFSGLAVLPLVLYALTRGRFYTVFMAGLKTTIFTIVLSALADRYFYGQWKLSVLNLVLYNVIGGGDSILYGVEGPLFYIRNALNNFNIALVLALILPLFLVFLPRPTDRHLVPVVWSLLMWLGFMSLQPHKEERFLYPVYSLLCVAASASIERFPEMVPSFLRKHQFGALLHRVLKLMRPLALSAILVLSYSRTTSLLNGYSAPMHIYSYLPANPEAPQTVCVGSEWHRFPSSLFIPSPKYEVKWLDDGFRGLLPLPFNATLGGTSAAPAFVNKQNKASPVQFIKDENLCDYLVELVLERPGVSYRGDDDATWKVLAGRYFLDNEKSPALYRAFFVPWLWESRNKFGTYRLLERQRNL